MDSDCGSPGSAAGGPGLRITRSTGSDSANAGGVSPSPSSQRPPSSRSPSPERGHHRSQTQRVRDLLSTIDKLVMASEQSEDAPAGGRPLSATNGNIYANDGGGGSAAAAAAAAGDAAPRSRNSTGGIDPRNGGLDRSALLDLLSPPIRGDGEGSGAEGDGHSPVQKAFFPNKDDVPPPPPEAATVTSTPGAEEEDDILAEVGKGTYDTNRSVFFPRGCQFHLDPRSLMDVCCCDF